MPRTLIAICYLGWMFDFYDLALFSFLLVPVAATFHLSGSQEAWLLGTGLGASGVGGILFGWCADRFGRRSVMVWTILTFSLGTALSAFAPNAEIFLLLRILTGLGIGGEWAIGHALVAESVPPDKRGRAAAWLQSGEPVGVALAAIVGLLLTPYIGWRAVMLGSGCTAFLAFLVRRHVPESPLWEQERGSRAIRQNESLHWLASGEGLSLMVRAFILALFKLGTYWTCYVWLPKFFLTEFHEPIGRSAMWILTAQLGQFSGMMVFGKFSDRFGRRQAYTLYSAITAIALYLLAFHWSGLLEDKPLFWITMFLLGIGSGCTAGFGALLAELFPTEVRNFAMGTTYNLARGMQIFGPVLVAAFATRWHVAGALSVPLTLAVLTGIWVWTLPETRTRDLAHVLVKPST